MYVRIKRHLIEDSNDLNFFDPQDPDLSGFMKITYYCFLVGYAVTILPAGYYSQKISLSFVTGVTMLLTAVISLIMPFIVTQSNSLTYFFHFLSGITSV